MVECVFCKIVNKEMSSLVVLETSSTLVIIPKEMEVRGHLLVMPKNHVENLFDAQEKDMKDIMGVIRKVSLLVKGKLGATGVNVLHATGKDAQQSVPHMHFHIIPRFSQDGVDAWIKQSNIKKYRREDVLREFLS